MEAIAGVSDKGGRLGFLGGSFDPIHVGHMMLALDALDQLKLDRLYFVPALSSPLREGVHSASFEHRLAMLKLLLKADQRLGVLDIERSLPQPSYTINTARILRTRFAKDRLYWVIGADQLAKLSAWREIEELVTIVDFAVARRPGIAIQPPAISKLSIHLLNQRLIEVSSSEIRQRLAQNLPVIGMTMPEIVDYIKEHALYQIPLSTNDAN